MRILQNMAPTHRSRSWHLLNTQGGSVEVFGDHISILQDLDIKHQRLHKRHKHRVKGTKREQFCIHTTFFDDVSLHVYIYIYTLCIDSREGGKCGLQYHWTKGYVYQPDLTYLSDAPTLCLPWISHSQINTPWHCLRYCIFLGKWNVSQHAWLKIAGKLTPNMNKWHGPTRKKHEETIAMSLWFHLICWCNSASRTGRIDNW